MLDMLLLAGLSIRAANNLSSWLLGWGRVCCGPFGFCTTVLVGALALAEPLFPHPSSGGGMEIPRGHLCCPSICARFKRPQLGP